jgi:eukaryotic-like serine/threonine-protein kinase
LLLALAILVIAGIVFVPQLLAGTSPPPQVHVPNIKHLTVAAAEAKLKQRGLRLGHQTKRYSSSIRRGHIVRQLRAPHMLVNKGSAVPVWVSAGHRRVEIPPRIATMTLRNAERKLKSLGLNVKAQPNSQSQERRNEVTGTNPLPGTRVDVGSTVTVYYSTGFVTVPSVIGYTKREAESALGAHHLTPVVSHVVSNEPVGTVVGQAPKAYTKQPPGTTVVIDVSLGPPKTPPPPSPSPTPTPTPTPTPPTTSSPPSTTPPTTTTSTTTTR